MNARGFLWQRNASSLPLRRDRLLLSVDRTFQPTRSGTGSFSRSHQPHASGQGLPLIRTLLQTLDHGLQARLRTFPVGLGDRGGVVFAGRETPARRPSTDRVVLVRCRTRTGASAATAPSSRYVWQPWQYWLSLL